MERTVRRTASEVIKKFEEKKGNTKMKILK